MTTLIVTKDHVFTDTRGTLGIFKTDGFCKAIHDPRQMQTYFIVGAKETLEEFIYYRIFGEWRKPNKVAAIVDDFKDGGGWDVFVMDANGDVLSIDISLDKNDTPIFKESVAGIPAGRDIPFTAGSGGIFAEAALLQTKDMDYVFHTVSLLDKYTSSCYYSVCRNTHTKTFHPGRV